MFRFVFGCVFFCFVFVRVGLLVGLFAVGCVSSLLFVIELCYSWFYYVIVLIGYAARFVRCLLYAAAVVCDIT